MNGSRSLFEFSYDRNKDSQRECRNGKEVKSSSGLFTFRTKRLPREQDTLRRRLSTPSKTHKTWTRNVSCVHEGRGDKGEGSQGCVDDVL